ncbi:MAG TPA: hypothetical protein VH302_05730 [Bryobacteraceae bacterium]|jgi:drug/metabolite transporter (DMT)-like permease|nr:hypothetical protein [Bryobacteraceae bacterium]
MKNAVFVALIVLGNTFGNTFLAISMSQLPGFFAVSLFSYVVALLTNPWFLSGTFLIALSMFAQLSMYTWADLSYILPVTASGYVVTTVFGRFFLNESVSISRWIGVVIIAFGVVLVAETRADTKHLEGVNE